MNAKAVERLSLESRLRQALANDELELHFQPFIDLDTAEVLGRRGAAALAPPGARPDPARASSSRSPSSRA